MKCREIKKGCPSWKIGYASTAYGLITGTIGGGVSTLLAAITGNYCESETQNSLNSLLNTSITIPSFMFNLMNFSLPEINQIVYVQGVPLHVQFTPPPFNLSFPSPSFDFTPSEIVGAAGMSLVNATGQTVNFICSFDIGLQGAGFSAVAASLVGLLHYTYQHNQALKEKIKDIESARDDSDDAPLIRLHHTV